MATRKKKAKAKAKPKTKRKAPARKPAVRKKPVKKKTALKRSASTKKPAARPSKRPAAKAKAVSLPAHPGIRLGVVIHYFGHLSVAVVKLEQGTLRIGDTIHFKGHTSDFSQLVSSLQVNHQSVTAVGPNDDFGMKVTNHARVGDVVYKV